MISFSADSVSAPSCGFLVMRGHIEFVQFIFWKAPSGSILPETSQSTEGNCDESGACGENEEKMRATVVDQETGGQGSKWSTSDICIDSSSSIEGTKHEEVRELPGSNEVAD